MSHIEEGEIEFEEPEEKPKPRKKMKIEKEPDGAWKIQFSWKLNQHMLNLRADSIEEFRESMKELLDAPELIGMAVGAFDVKEPELPLAPAPPRPAPAPAVTVKSDQGTEVGPIKVEKVEHQEGIGKTGRPYTRHIVNLSGGVKASTFDSLVADAAQHLLGRDCYARVEKGKFGYELLNIRPAA